MKIEKHRYNACLANYFSSLPLFFDGDLQKKPHVRKCVELPFQQTKAQLWDEVTDTLCNLYFIQAKSVSKLTYDLMEDYNQVLEVLPENQENIKKELKRQGRLDKYIKDLIAYANGEIKELEIIESITPWTEEHIDVEIDRIKTNPTRADKLKDFYNFLGHEVDNLQNYASEIKYFALQQAWNFAADGGVGNAAENITENISRFLLLLVKKFRPLWNPLPLKLKTLRLTDVDLRDICITPDGKKAVTVLEDKFIVWDLSIGKSVITIKRQPSLETGMIPSKFTSISVSPNAKYAISGSEDHLCIVWDLESGLQINSFYERFEYSDKWPRANILSDCKRAYYSTGTKCIIWNIEAGEPITILNVENISITADCKKAISFSDKNCIIWDLETGIPVKTLLGHTDNISFVSISPDGRRAISGSYNETCILWDLDSGKPLRTLTGITGCTNLLRMTHDEKLAITLSNDGYFILWDLINGQPIRTINSEAENIFITPDGNFAISQEYDSCTIWNLESGRTEESPPEPVNIENQVSDTPEGQYESIHLTLDGKRAIALGGVEDPTCTLWNLKGNELLKTYKGHNGYITKVSFSLNGKCIIASSWDKNCYLWDLESSILLNRLVGHSDWVMDAKITPDGLNAISGSYDGTCILWDLTNGQPIKRLYGHSGRIRVVSITSDGKKAISGSEDKTCIVWDLESGKALNTFNGHWDWIMDIYISPDDKRVISSTNNTHILWDIESCKIINLVFNQDYNLEIPRFPRALGSDNYSDEYKYPEIIASKDLICTDIPIATGRQMWDFDSKCFQRLSIDCPLCGFNFKPEQKYIDIIKKILQNNNINPGESPCLLLPKETWEDPGLLSSCPKCGAKLKFNPFIAGGDY
jgi:WD40 repeat protein